MARRWYQFNLKSLMAVVVLICLGLGGGHLLFVYGQYVEAEPAVVGQPIKIRGKFFHFGGKDPAYPAGLPYNLVVEQLEGSRQLHCLGCSKYLGRFRYEMRHTIHPTIHPNE
jgi:hypothetical protein